MPPACSDGLDNDGDNAIDFDGGASVFGSPVAPPDLHCSSLTDDREAAPPRPTCGIGPEPALVPLIAWARRGRKREA